MTFIKFSASYTVMEADLFSCAFVPSSDVSTAAVQSSADCDSRLSLSFQAILVFALLLVHHRVVMKSIGP